MGEFRVQVHRRLWIITIAATLFLSVSISLFAGGQKEDLLAQAEILISERKYNEAILIITEVMKNEPDQFDRCQRMIGEIRDARTAYNDTYAELIDIYDSGDLEKAYEIIKTLESLDRDPNKATAQSLVTARETAGFVYNQNRFLDIMTRAESANNQGLYRDAISIYLSGFDLSRDIFDGENYGSVIVNQIDRESKRISDTSSMILEVFGALAAAESGILAAVTN